MQEGVFNEPILKQYTLAFYWALQTLTTVGFGDITIKTRQERLFAIGWMVIGISFYSFAIGQISTFIQNTDRDQERLNIKMAVLKEFRTS